MTLAILVLQVKTLQTKHDKTAMLFLQDSPQNGLVHGKRIRDDDLWVAHLARRRWR